MRHRVGGANAIWACMRCFLVVTCLYLQRRLKWHIIIFMVVGRVLVMKLYLGSKEPFFFHSLYSLSLPWFLCQPIQKSIVLQFVFILILVFAFLTLFIFQFLHGYFISFNFYIQFYSHFLLLFFLSFSWFFFNFIPHHFILFNFYI